MGEKIQAKKSLGQHFLKDKSIIERILDVAHIAADDMVFEVGPGLGALTEALSKRAKKVFAIELDHALVERLQKNFETTNGVSILEGNVLDVDLNELLEHAGFVSGRYKIVANLPYYVTAPILRTLLALRCQPQSLTLMVQREVAERLAAKPGDMSLLSLMAQQAATVTVAFTVPPEAFDPVPTVESAVVQLRPSRPFDPVADRQLFRIARMGFAARRKTLANNLSAGLKVERSHLETVLKALGLRPDIRAQALSLSDWKRLQEKLAADRLTE